MAPRIEIRHLRVAARMRRVSKHRYVWSFSGYVVNPKTKAEDFRLWRFSYDVPGRTFIVRVVDQHSSVSSRQEQYFLGLPSTAPIPPAFGKTITEILKAALPLEDRVQCSRASLTEG